MAYLGNQPTSTAFVTDQFSGTGSQTAFTMSVAPAGTTSVLVSITGVLQDPSTYSVSGTTLTFSAAPPTGTGNISVRYLGIPASGVTATAYRTVTEFTATAGQTTFSVPSYTVGYIAVYRNGVRLGADDFTASNGTSVVLASAAALGDLVVTESFYVSSVLNAIPAVAGAVTSTYILDGAVTTEKLAAGAVTQADVATGVAGTGPAFKAVGTGQTVATGVSTKITFGTEQYDTHNCYDAANSKFQPNIAGYYQINCNVQYSGTGYTAYFVVQLFKNGSNYEEISVIQALTYAHVATSTLVYLNGTTDYLEVFATQIQGGSQTMNGVSFSGFLARAA